MLDSIKSNFVLKIILQNIGKNAYLRLLKNNKKLQSKLDLSINTYKEYYNQIEIEIIPNEKSEEEKNIFMNASKVLDYKVYFKSSFDEEKRDYFTNKENITKIRLLVITNGINQSLCSLFQDCQCLKEVKIIHCSRINITDISYMFLNCKSLISVDLSRLNTENVEDMSAIFGECTSLKNVNLSKIKTDNLKNMEHMFVNCSSLEKIDLSYFSTYKVTNMKSLFSGCSSLKELKISNF